jgi:hypothetical protein
MNSKLQPANNHSENIISTRPPQTGTTFIQGSIAIKGRMKRRAKSHHRQWLFRGQFYIAAIIKQGTKNGFFDISCFLNPHSPKQQRTQY